MFFSLNMDCLRAFCGHFLLYNLPKILSPKDVILLFKLTKNFVTFVVMSFSSGAANEATTTGESKQTTNVTKIFVNLKRRITFFGERIWVSCIIKCDHKKPSNNSFLFKFFCSKLKSYHNKYWSFLKIWFSEIRSQDISLSLLADIFEFCCDFDVNKLYQLHYLSL